MNIVGYLRVSSKAQYTATQRSAIERTASARGDPVITWYEEKRSGKTIVRPELDRLRQDARAGLVRKLYVFKLDRFARSGVRDTFEVVESLPYHGVELISVADGFDFSDPAAEVVLAVMAWAAKVERLAIRERIGAAMERLQAQGKSWGRPQRLKDADRARILALKSEGRSVWQISLALKVPRATVGRAVARLVA